MLQDGGWYSSFAAAELEYAASTNWPNCLHSSSGSQSYTTTYSKQWAWILPHNTKTHKHLMLGEILIMSWSKNTIIEI